MPRSPVPLCLAAALLASGCTESQLRINPDFGVAVHQDVAAQIANPIARYSGYPPAGSDGSRAALAQKRYSTDKVIRPASSSLGSNIIGSSSSGSTDGEGAAQGAEAVPSPAPQ